MKDAYQLFIGWIKKDLVSKSYDEDLSYSYHVMEVKTFARINVNQIISYLSLFFDC